MWTRIQTVVEGIAPRSTLTGPWTCHHTKVPLLALLQMIIQGFHWRGCYVELIGLGSAWLWVRRGRGCRPSRTPDGMGVANRDSSRKGTSTQCAGEVPTQGAGTAGTKTRQLLRLRWSRRQLLQMGQTPRQLVEWTVQSDEMAGEEGKRETSSPTTQTYVAEDAV